MSGPLGIQRRRQTIYSSLAEVHSVGRYGLGGGGRLVCTVISVKDSVSGSSWPRDDERRDYMVSSTLSFLPSLSNAYSRRISPRDGVLYVPNQMRQLKRNDSALRSIVCSALSVLGALCR